MASKDKTPFDSMQKLFEQAKITQGELVEEYAKPGEKPKPSGRSQPAPSVKPKDPPAGSKGKKVKGKPEFFDSEEELAKKLDIFAEWVKDSRHFIVFTGAGISTSTGIPDFRSGMNTVLPTGPGAWELKAHGLQRKKGVNTLAAIPSTAHMALVKLQREGLVKFVISQNTDGLHRRSGLGAEDMAELHGNTNREICKKCGAEYLRDFRVRNASKVHDHYTGRTCDKTTCNGRLEDTIINFGESLPEDELDKGFDAAKKADLCLVLGSSLTVTPAADIPDLVAERGQKLVIGNIQMTPLHSNAKLALFAMCDPVMEGLMSRLGIEIPKFILKRRVVIQTKQSESKKSQGTHEIVVSGMDVARDVPYSFITSVQFKISQVVKGKETVLANTTVSREPMSIQFKVATPLSGAPVVAKITLEFRGHYGEPIHELEYKATKSGVPEEFLLQYDPRSGEWLV